MRSGITAPPGSCDVIVKCIGKTELMWSTSSDCIHVIYKCDVYRASPDTRNKMSNVCVFYVSVTHWVAVAIGSVSLWEHKLLNIRVHKCMRVCMCMCVWNKPHQLWWNELLYYGFACVCGYIHARTHTHTHTHTDTHTHIYIYIYIYIMFLL